MWATTPHSLALSPMLTLMGSIAIGGAWFTLLLSMLLRGRRTPSKHPTRERLFLAAGIAVAAGVAVLLPMSIKYHHLLGVTGDVLLLVGVTTFAGWAWVRRGDVLAPRRERPSPGRFRSSRRECPHCEHVFDAIPLDGRCPSCGSIDGARPAANAKR